jgi:hypothetical protein
VITCDNTSGFAVNATVEFKGSGSLGGIQVNGTVYFIHSVLTSTTFKIKDSSGTIVNLTTAIGNLQTVVGGTPAVRVTTTIANGLTENKLVRLDGTVGSIQLNNNLYYVHIINSFTFDLYTQAYNPALGATNYPVTTTSSYESGGYVWVSGSFRIYDTTATNTTYDYTVSTLNSATIYNLNIFFEMKNYTSDVRSDEVSKFLRDMKEHPEVHVGIFISLHTRITGKDREKPISIEWINDSQCAVYIQAFKELDEIHTLSLIDQIIKMSSIYNKMIRSNGDISEESMLQGRIDKARVYIEEYITETCSLIKRVTNDQKLHRQLVESSYSHTLAVLKTQSNTINTALEILTGEYKENNIIDETIIDTVEEVKPKKAGKKKV